MRVTGSEDVRRGCDSCPGSAGHPKLCQKLRRTPPTLTKATDAEIRCFQRPPTPTDARKWLPKAGALPDCATPRSDCAAIRYTEHLNYPITELCQDLTRNQTAPRADWAVRRIHLVFLLSRGTHGGATRGRALSPAEPGSLRYSRSRIFLGRPRPSRRVGNQ
jgi:hypothetical protein